MATAISRITIALALALAAMAPSTAGASPGDLDPGFSGDGIKRLTGFTFAGLIKNDPQGGVIVEVNGGRLVRLSQSGRIDRSFADDGVLDPGIPVRSRYGVLFTIRLFDRVNGRILGRGLTEGANGRWGIDRRLRGGRYSLLLRGRRLEDRLVCSRARLDFRLPRQSRR